MIAEQIIQAFLAAVVAVLIVGALAGCSTTPDMSRSEAVNITNLAVILDKHNERKMPKR